MAQKIIGPKNNEILEYYILLIVKIQKKRLRMRVAPKNDKSGGRSAFTPCKYVYMYIIHHDESWWPKLSQNQTANYNHYQPKSPTDCGPLDEI